MLSLALVAALGGSGQGALTDWLSVLLNLAGTNNNGPLWSLSLEEVLYFLLGVLFYAGVYRRLRTAVVALMTLYVLTPIAVTFLPASQAPGMTAAPKPLAQNNLSSFTL